MDFRSPTFLIITLAMFAIAAYAFIVGIIPLGIIFALFGVGGLLVRFTVRKKK
ncbi:MAG: hypothetical protein ABS965_06530 [Succiniclasticum sp.]